MTLELSVLPPDAADDAALVDEVVALVNAAYELGEAGLWTAGTRRTADHAIAELVRDGRMIVARRDGRTVACGCLRAADALAVEDAVELGLVSVAPEAWGGGIGSAVVRFAEEVARERGVRTMVLKLLVPEAGTHPDKERLRAWYERLGYSVFGRLAYEEVAAGAERLLTPCAFLVFRKPLAVSPRA
jgi:GNAT superfamily N-acetyltransferase